MVPRGWGKWNFVCLTSRPHDLTLPLPAWSTLVLQPELLLSSPSNRRYVVLNRPYALLQWVQQATIPEKYVLMSEPDHLWLRPMANLMKGTR